MIDEKELNQWWHSLSIKQQDSYKRLINGDTIQSMEYWGIKLAHDFYEEELELAAKEYWDKLDISTVLDADSFETSFIAGCKFILNNKNQWM